MIKTGSQDLDNFLKEYKEISLIYGPGGSGKTTLALLAAIEQATKNKKVIFIDTENSFSTERFTQLLDYKSKSCLENILILNIKNFNIQHKHIKQLEEIKNISLIIIDSITNYYRRLYKSQPELAKAMIAKQMIILNKITKNNIPIIITSQVYSDMKDNVIPLANSVLPRYSQTIIKLEEKPRKIKIIKPEKKEIRFEIINTGIKTLK